MAEEQTPIITAMPTTPDVSPGAFDLRAQVAKLHAEHANDPALQSKVAALYKAHYGSGKVPIGGGITVEGKPESPPAAMGEGQKGGQWTPEQRTQEEARVLGQLRTEWGGDYDANFTAAQRGAQHLVQTVFGGDWSKFQEAAQDLGDDLKGMRILTEIGRRL